MAGAPSAAESVKGLRSPARRLPAVALDRPVLRVCSRYEKTVFSTFENTRTYESGGYTVEMHEEVVVIDCTELDDFEIEDLRRFAESQPGVESFALKQISWDTERFLAAESEIEIHAAAAPILFVIHFAKGHLLSSGAEAYAAKKVFDGACNVVKEWSKRRADRYQTLEILGSDGSVAKVVKVRKMGADS